jgi:hypothetical protein
MVDVARALPRMPSNLSGGTMADRDDNQRRDPYRDNDDARDPLPPDQRDDVQSDSRFEGRGDARENVGRNARGTDTDRTDASGNDRNADRPRRDEFDEDLANDNRRGHEGSSMAHLAQETRSSVGPAGLTGDQQERGEGHVQHDRQGQAQSPVERTHFEPPRHKEGH